MTPLEDNATTTAHPDCPHCGERSCVAGTTGGGLSCSRCGADVGMGEALAAALAEVARLREEAEHLRAHRTILLAFIDPCPPGKPGMEDCPTYCDGCHCEALQ